MYEYMKILTVNEPTEYVECPYCNAGVYFKCGKSGKSLLLCHDCNYIFELRVEME